MELDKAKQIGIELLDQHGLIDLGWHFKLDSSKRRFGVCKFKSQTIGLSSSLTLLNEEKRVRNTILHEIAHALVGSKHGHDEVWRAKALEIGCDGERCYSDDVTRPKGNYEAVCGLCGHTHIRFKKPTKKKQSCGACATRFDPNNLLVWISTK